MSLVEHVVFLLEEPSTEAALNSLLPVLLGNTRTYELHQFGGKQRMIQRLPNRLAGYATWLPPTWRIVVVLDRDDDDCVEIKSTLNTLASSAGLRVKTLNANWQLANRIAVEELEAWFFGDWAAVRQAYPRVPATIDKRAPYRHPDAIVGGTAEALERLLQEAGYFSGGLGKIELARAVTPHMVPNRNRSPSFACFRDLLTAL